MRRTIVRDKISEHSHRKQVQENQQQEKIFFETQDGFHQEFPKINFKPLSFFVILLKSNLNPMLAKSKIKVAIVDDEAQMREMLKDFVEQKFPAAEISMYSSGEEALEKIYEEPDMIILDYLLDSKNSEAMNGVQVLKKLKER